MLLYTDEEDRYEQNDPKPVAGETVFAWLARGWWILVLLAIFGIYCAMLGSRDRGMTDGIDRIMPPPATRATK